MSEGYNIVVCIKQVPETTEVDFDEETGRLKREGVAAVINPFDEYAIEEGLKIKEAHGGTVLGAEGNDARSCTVWVPSATPWLR